MAGAADDQPFRLVPRVPPRIGIGFVLAGQLRVGIVLASVHAIGGRHRRRRRRWRHESHGKPGRGYFGIGAEGVSKSANVGALLRTGHAFGASFCFTIGTGWDSRAARTADTADTPSHVPMWRYPTLADMSLPRGCALVGIELLEDAVDLPSFRHPLNAAYVLGPERAGLSAALLERCDHVVRIPTRFALEPGRGGRTGAV